MVTFLLKVAHIHQTMYINQAIFWAGSEATEYNYKELLPFHYADGWRNVLSSEVGISLMQFTPIDLSPFISHIKGP